MLLLLLLLLIMSVMQVSVALNPDNDQAKAFKECVIIKHPRSGEFAFGFITGESFIQVIQMVLRRGVLWPMRLCSHWLSLSC